MDRVAQDELVYDSSRPPVAQAGTRQGDIFVKSPAPPGLLSGRPSIEVAERENQATVVQYANVLDLIASRSWWIGGLWPMVPSPARLVPINSR
jgi:hypothetical protein